MALVPTHYIPIPPTTYEEFQTTHGAPQLLGGPWFSVISYTRWIGETYTVAFRDFCDGNCYVLYTRGSPAPNYHYDLTFFANVSYPKQDLPDSGSVNVEWGFSAMYAKTAGVQYSINSSVASMPFQSSLTSVDFSRAEVDYWSGTSYRYTSSVLPTVYQHPSLVYFPLTISFASILETTDTFSAFFAKNFSFNITNGRSAPPTDLSSSDQSKTRVIAGSVVGGVLLIGLVTLMWILYRRRKGYGILKRRRQGDNADSVDYEAKNDRQVSNQIPENPEAFVIPGGPVNRMEDGTPNSLGPLLTPRGPLDVSHKTNDTLLNQPGPSGVGNATNQSSGMSTFGNEEAPPDYREPSVFSHDEPSTSSQPPRRRTLPTQSQTLAQYAEEHRNFIPEGLEEKLSRAGYVPTDDPDALAEDVWKRDYGVTPLELIRLRGLYRGSVY